MDIKSTCVQTLLDGIDLFMAECENFVSNSLNSVVVGGTVNIIPITAAEKAALLAICQSLDDLASTYLGDVRLARMVALEATLA